MLILKRECDFFWVILKHCVERIETVYSPESSTWMWSLLEGPGGIFSFSSDDPPMSMPPFLLIDKEGVEGGGGLVFGSFQRAKLPNMLPLLERPIPAPAKKNQQKRLCKIHKFLLRSKTFFHFCTKCTNMQSGWKLKKKMSHFQYIAWMCSSIWIFTPNMV